MKVGAYLARLALPRARLFRREPYLVGVFHVPGFGSPVEVRTQPLSGVNKRHAVTFDAPGLELIAPVEIPGGRVVGRLEVWESDSDHRAAGERLKRIGAALDELPSVRHVAKVAAASTGMTFTAIAEAAAVITRLLATDGDDRLASFDVDLDLDNLQESRAVAAGLDGSHGWSLDASELAFILASPRAELVIHLTVEGGGAS